MSGRYSNNLKKSQVTIAQVLKTSGYRTGMVGKWHLGKRPDRDGPIQRGFDDFYGTMTGAGSFFDPYTLARNTSGATDITLQTTSWPKRRRKARPWRWGTSSTCRWAGR